MPHQTRLIGFLNLAANIFLGLVFLASVGGLFFGAKLISEAPRGGLVTLLVSVSLIAILVISVFVGHDKRINIAISLFSGIFGIYALNLIVSAWLSPVGHEFSEQIDAAHARGLDWDERSKLQVITELRHQGHDAYSATFPDDSFFSKRPINLFGESERDIWPLSGISGVTTVYGIESGRYMVYPSDRYGFNNEDSVYADAEHRIMLLGDSFTQGCCVQPGEDIAGSLRSSGFNAINMGMGGNGPLLELATLREYGNLLQPEIVLWIYYENDLVNLLREYNNPVLRQYLEDQEFTQNLATRQPETNEFWKNTLEFWESQQADQPQEKSEDLEVKEESERWIDEIKSLILLRELRTRLALIRSFSSYYQTTSQNLNLLRPVLEAARNETEKLNAQIYLVYLPSYETYSEGADTSRVRVMSLAKELGIPVLDFYRFLRDDGDPLKIFPFRLRAHYNAEGYELVADLIALEVLVP